MIHRQVTMTPSLVEKTIEHGALPADTVKRIRILGVLGWPVEDETKFLEGWRAGSLALPRLKLDARDCTRELEVLITQYVSISAR